MGFRTCCLKIRNISRNCLEVAEARRSTLISLTPCPCSQKQIIKLPCERYLPVPGRKQTFLSPETGNSRFISLFITPSPNSFILSILCRCVFCCPKGRKDSCSSHFFASSFSCEGSPVHVKIQFLLCMLFSCSSVFASLIIRPSQRPHECGRKFFLPLPHC